uniref:USP domain-containing protein n=1 Tax=Heligmosomoides polygyrus TaxID=6339 RepID=A0A183F9F0_HELPZ
LVNVLPDLVCRICRWEEQVPLSDFKCLVRKLLSMVEEKPLDVVVEKMCQRFEFCNRREATEHNRHIAYYFSYFISQLILSDSSFYKHDAEEFLRKMEFLHVRSTLSCEERDRLSRAVGPINLDVPVRLDKEGNPIMFTFADCDEPVEYDDS